MRILGIDPGEDIGLSYLDTETGEDKSWQFNVHESDEEAHITLYLVLDAFQPNVIACEDFYHIPRYMKLNMLTAELIGVVKLYGQHNNIQVHMQNRGMKTGWPAVKLKMLGLWQPGEENTDAMDALRHRLVYQEKHGLIDWTKLKP